MEAYYAKTYFAHVESKKVHNKTYLNLELKSWEPHGPWCHKKDFVHHSLML
jgi:hypothetical protein